MLKNIFLLLVALFVISALAAPVQDISETSVALETSTDALNNGHLTVTVTRVDDLLSDEGEWLAERVMAVVMVFDVDNEQLLLNNVPLPLGASSLQIEAAIIANTDLLTISDAEDATALAASFDTGLVTVEVEASADLVTDENGIPLRRITVFERIVEIDGQTVVQTVAGQQILDVYEDGTVMKYGGCDGSVQAPEELDSASQPLEQATTSCEKFRQWYNRQPFFARISMVSVTGAILAGILAATFRFISARRRGYNAVPVAEIEVIYDEKYPVDKAQNPPAYEEGAHVEDVKE